MQSCIPTIPLFPPTPSFHCISESIFPFSGYFMLSVLPFALLDCKTILSNLHPCERRRPRSGVSSASRFRRCLLLWRSWELCGPLLWSVTSGALVADLMLCPEKKKTFFFFRRVWLRCNNVKILPFSTEAPGARARSCRHVRAPGKDSEKDGESKRRIDSARVQRRYVSASDREDSPGGRSQPFSTKNDT